MRVTSSSSSSEQQTRDGHAVDCRTVSHLTAAHSPGFIPMSMPLLFDNNLPHHIVMALSALNAAMKLVCAGFVQWDRRGFAVLKIHAQIVDLQSVNPCFIV